MRAIAEIQLPRAGRRGPRLRESLSGEGDPARLGDAQGLLHGGKPSRRRSDTTGVAIATRHRESTA